MCGTVEEEEVIGIMHCTLEDVTDTDFSSTVHCA